MYKMNKKIIWVGCGAVVVIFLGVYLFGFNNSKPLVVKEITLTPVTVTVPYDFDKYHSNPSKSLSFSETINGFSYERIDKPGFTFFDGPTIRASDLYVYKQDQKIKLISIFTRNCSINSNDYGIANFGSIMVRGYVDRRNNIYFSNDDGIYVIRDGDIIGRINNKWPGRQLAMFSDEENTYLIIEKSDYCVYGSVSDNMAMFKFKIDLP